VLIGTQEQQSCLPINMLLLMEIIYLLIFFYGFDVNLLQHYSFIGSQWRNQGDGPPPPLGTIIVLN